MIRNHLLPRIMWLAVVLPHLVFAQPEPPQGPNAAELLLGIQKAQVLGTVLYVAAHPDDENTALLAYLAKGRKYRTAYLSLTRGDGGQNLIGPEQGPLLGLIRTQELLAARRIDGAEQYFTRAIDYGYSKHPDEAFRIWNRDSLLHDVVWIIRKLQPDVIITRFDPNGAGQTHGHHTASAIIAVEAFQAAADPKRFPEQLKHVRPWQAKRIFWNTYSGFAGQMLDKIPAGTAAVDVGEFNPLLGESYTEIAGRSRSMHSSQGFGAARNRGSRMDYLQLLAGEPFQRDFMEGIDPTWARLGSPKVGIALAEAEKAFNPLKPEAALPALLEAYRHLPASPSPLLQAKSEELKQLILGTSGIYVEAVADRVVNPEIISHRVTIRSDVPVSVRFENGPDTTLAQQKPYSKPAEKVICYGETTTYWLRSASTVSRFAFTGYDNLGQPESEPLVSRLTLKVGPGNQAVELPLDVPVRYKWVDPAVGERLRPGEVPPPVVLSLPTAAQVWGNNQARSLAVKVISTMGAQRGSVRLKVPQGWQVNPANQAFELKATDAETTLLFTVTPANSASQGSLQAIAEVNGQTYDRARIRVEYPHIPIQTVFPKAEVRVVRADVKLDGQQIGYVMGAGDEVPQALEQIGLAVKRLSDADFDQPLSNYGAIVVGIRAYNTAPRMRNWYPKLMDYVAQGGRLIVQYQIDGRGISPLAQKEIGPYPLTIGRDRVTEEDAALVAINPNHPLLNQPNKLTSTDFAGWVQERGLYFATSWDAKYQPVFRSHDTGEKDLEGSLLVAPHGKGVFIYTGLAFFRQLPAGVPGAYRLFANLLSVKPEALPTTLK